MNKLTKLATILLSLTATHQSIASKLSPISILSLEHQSPMTEAFKTCLSSCIKSYTGMVTEIEKMDFCMRLCRQSEKPSKDIGLTISVK